MDHPDFYPGLQRCSQRNLKMKEIGETKAPKFWKTLRKIPLIAGIVVELFRIYLIKPIDAEALRGMVK